MVEVIELNNVRDLDRFIGAIKSNEFDVELGPHYVLEDHSEVITLKISKGGAVVAYVVAHYITQHYKAILKGYSDNSTLQQELLKVSQSGEKWSIPVNPLYVILIEESLIDILKSYADEYPIKDGESVIKEYRSRNPNYKAVPKVVVAKFVDPLD